MPSFPRGHLLIYLPPSPVFRNSLSRGAFPFASNGQQEATMKIQEGGNEHSIGDKNCPGCESPEGDQFPQPHRDPVTNCLGLVHAEIFAEESKPSAGEAVLYRCDVCGGSI